MVAFGGSILGSRLGNAMIVEGTVPVPPNRPCAERDSDVLPVRGLSHFRGSHSGGGETPMSVQLGIEHFSRTTVSVYLSSALITSPSHPLGNSHQRIRDIDSPQLHSPTVTPSLGVLTFLFSRKKHRIPAHVFKPSSIRRFPAKIRILRAEK